jgi:lipopolysaccharide/colanic/teichoic acid biosynthesis glycosyltransferase
MSILNNYMSIDSQMNETSVNLPGNGWYAPHKAMADRIVAGILLAVTAPLIGLLVLLVRANSPGPGIFKQVRLGRGGRPFLIYKIRTMSHNCERLTGPLWAKANDVRVTSLGRILRRSHLDELPQLWNVLRGEMSLVGPRPERPEFVKDLVPVIANYADRMAIVPGITGLAQVQLPPDERVDDVLLKVRCDLCYVREMSPLLDLKIMIGTALKLMGVSFERTRRILELPGCDLPGPAVAVPRPEPASIAQLQSA